jgi:hypothetical protein
LEVKKRKPPAKETNDRMHHRIEINRAPVLTLWAAVVAERLGFDWQEALTLGRAVTGLNAYSKGKALGLFEPTPEAVREKRDQLRRQKGAFSIDLLNRKVPAVHTEAGIRALQMDQPTNPASVMDNLERAFGDAFDDARNAMALLAGAHEPQELAAAGYRLYEEFRPEIPAGVRGWGAKGCLDLDQIRAMARAVR